MSDDFVTGGILPVDDSTTSADDPDAIESDFILDDEEASLSDGVAKVPAADDEDEDDDLFADE